MKPHNAYLLEIVLTAALAVAAIVALSHEARATERSSKAVAAFKRAHVCPSTGVTKNAPCPGHVVDHIKPLCFCGADSPENMMYMTIKDALKKDAFEREACALFRKSQKKCTAAAELAGDARSDRPPMKGELK